MTEKDHEAPEHNWAGAFCLKEIAPWLGRPLNATDLEAGLAYYNSTHRSVFLLAIEQGRVRLLAKPGFRVREEFNDSSAAVEDDAGLVYKEEFIRAEMYRGFFEHVLAFFQLPLDATLAIDVNDDPVQHVSVPIFAFQKRRGSNTLLVPDVDFLHNRFYLPAEYRDTIPYRDKTPTAVFAGSTTGGRTITEDDVRSLSIPRLRSAVFFKDKGAVDFRLPRIVQCASRETEQMIEALGFGVGRCSWAQQFSHRLILSMDGNGATCSRVAISLNSNSALLKYDSPHQLYYFNELVPWRHFIPVSSDAEVLDVVEAERRRPGAFQAIAEEGRALARTYLSWRGVAAYTAALLATYAEHVRETGPRLWTRWHDDTVSSLLDRCATVPDVEVEVEVEAGAHIQGLGDVWAWPGEWVGGRGAGRAIEAVVIAPGRPLGYEDVEYRVVLADGALSEWARGGELCGTRGRNAPLQGLCVRLSASAEASYDCAYRASFIGNLIPTSSRAGGVCAGGGAPLEAFRIEIIRKGR
jgi:hypothetical protein